MEKRQRAAISSTASPPEPTSSCSGKPPNCGEWLLFGLILAAGIALRVVRWSLTTVEHFDEGVYASNLWFGPEDGFQYPQQHLYAPPLTPWLIEWTMVLSGKMSGQAAIWPSLWTGVATIAVVWWLARNAFSARAGLVAATLAAVSGTHILLSRAALTDAPLLLWFVLAIGLFERACRTQRWLDFGWTGLAVGLAWWTKYNGWLPLFVAFVSLALRMFVCRSARSQARRLFAGWCIAVVVAVAVWSPHLLSLQSRGGYTTVAANHRQYIVGFSGWWSSLTRQLANLGYISGWCNADLLSLACGAAGTMIVLSGGWRTCRQRKTVSGWRLGETPPRGATAATWYCMLGAMTPLYTPYPRLLLPWLAAGWILSGAAVDSALNWQTPCGNSPSTQPVAAVGPSWRPAVLIGICLGLYCLTAFYSGRVWSDRRGLEEVAQRIGRAIEPSRENGGREIPSVVYVYGEPALVFHLRAADVAVVSPIQTVELLPGTANGVPVPTYLVAGPHALRDRNFHATWPAVATRYELIAKFSFTPSPLVLLDNYAPHQLDRGPPAEEVRLYRIK